ncbi:hypothetical protein MUP38_05030 [Candidatus Bathyarchaeota archaeon]|nr:hypothetical protein [Candidatus Bathyarchaeota archaeon]
MTCSKKAAYALKQQKNFFKRWNTLSYQPSETKTSQKQLQDILTRLKDPLCLLGGWAVYYIVNQNFQKATGRNYIGSRDIDLGFHINKDWNKEQLEKSEFMSTIETLENMGFRSVSFRLFKDFNLDNGQELTPEESAKLPLYQIFQLYIDPVVDNIHPEIKNLLGFVPIDEPLLSLVFQQKMHTIAVFFGKSIMLPKPHVVLAMKLNSAPRRDKEHKLIKDIADIYALSWYSDAPLEQLKSQLYSICSKEKTSKTIRNFTKQDLNNVSSLLGIASQELSRVLNELI